MSTDLVFLEHYTQEFHKDNVNNNYILKFLIDNQTKQEITNPEDWFDFTEGMHIEDIVEQYLDNHIYPVPDYTDDELAKTDFTKSVSVTLTLRLRIELTESYSLLSGASFWQQGECPHEDHEAFLDYIRARVKQMDLQEDEYAEADLASDMLHEDGWFVSVADKIQWRYLGELYSEFCEKEEVD